MEFDNLKILFKKTELGIEALRTRDASLPQKLRVLLILIDGKKDLSELASLITANADSLVRIKELLDVGFITEVMPHSLTNYSATTEPSSKFEIFEETENASIKLLSAIRAANKTLTSLLGPNSDVLAVQLEKCKSKDEYNAKILEFRKIIGTMRSEKLGDEFVKTAIL